VGTWLQIGGLGRRARAEAQVASITHKSGCDLLLSVTPWTEVRIKLPGSWVETVLHGV
jgi:hypothetical protein